MKLRYKTLSFILAASMLLAQPVYAEVKDNVGGMDTSPVYDEVNNKQTVSAGADQILTGYSAWVNGEPVIGTMSNLTGDVGYKAITENTIDSKPNAKITLNSTGKITAGTTYVNIPIETIKQNSPTLNSSFDIPSSGTGWQRYNDGACHFAFSYQIPTKNYKKITWSGNGSYSGFKYLSITVSNPSGEAISSGADISNYDYVSVYFLIQYTAITSGTRSSTVSLPTFHFE